MWTLTVSLGPLLITAAQMCQDCSKVWKEKKGSVRPALPDCPCRPGLIISADGKSSQKSRNWSQTGSANAGFQ